MENSIRRRLLLAWAPAPAAWLARGLAATWRVREIQAEGIAPQTCGERRYIYAFWHEYILPFAGCYRGERIHGLASRSFDGELISAVLRKLGYPDPARGSSSRGGDQALRALLGFLQAGDHVVVTVDGPRGPRRRAQEGVLKLAQLSGCQVAPVGCAASLGLRLRSWDRTLLPAPFCRLAFHFSQPFFVPPGQQDMAGWRNQLQASLEEATEAAERALAEGT